MCGQYWSALSQKTYQGLLAPYSKRQPLRLHVQELITIKKPYENERPADGLLPS